MLTSPSWIIIARWQNFSTLFMSWVTRMIVLPAARMSWKTSSHFCWNDGVADREHFVDQHDVGLGLDHHREGQADHHSRRIVLDLQFGELLEPGEFDHRLDPPRASCRESPSITAFSTMFSRAVISGLKPTPSSMNGAMRPATWIRPRSAR